MKNIIFYLFSIVLLAACKKNEPTEIGTAEPNEQLAGGTNGTTYVFSENAFGVQVKNTTSAEQDFFVTGNSFFRANWVTAPASVQSLDGLGAVFNAISCGSCHFKDGRAQPPASPDEKLNGLLFRLSNDPVYGGQLQDKSILGVDAEASVRVSYDEVGGSFGDGTPYSLRRPNYEFFNKNYGDFAPNWQFSPRIAQQLPGLGLLEIVPEAEILAFADENDGDGDGISGRANWVFDVEKQTTALGRFGWKANQPSLKQQTAGAFAGDIGITSNLFPSENFTPVQLQKYPNLPNGGSPEISDETLKKVVVYLQTLAVPARRDHDKEDVLRGKFLFQKLNCQKCHRPMLQTGEGGNIEALKNQKIWAYTDLLLHDLGDDLADGRPDFLATGREWRTPPLWGLGLLQTVNGHQFLLHDGRARGVAEAILWHGGEAMAARDGFKNLSKSERENLIKFLESL